MEKDIGKIKKNEITDIIVRVDDFGGKVGLTIREYTTSDRYTGFTKSGTRIPLESINEFKKMISSINEADLKAMESNHEKQNDSQKTLERNESNSEEIEEEVF